jgi:hypothetical protein
MLNGSNISQLSWDSGKSVNDLLLLDDFPFSYDLGVLVTTTIVEGVLLEFPITQDLLDSQATSTMDATSRPKGSKSDTCYPQTVSDSVSDGPQCLNSKVLSDSVEVITTTKAAPRSESIWEKRKELQERRFTHPQKMKSSYALGGRY